MRLRGALEEAAGRPLRRFRAVPALARDTGVAGRAPTGAVRAAASELRRRARWRWPNRGNPSSPRAAGRSLARRTGARRSAAGRPSAGQARQRQRRARAPTNSSRHGGTALTRVCAFDQARLYRPSFPDAPTTQILIASLPRPPLSPRPRRRFQDRLQGRSGPRRVGVPGWVHVVRSRGGRLRHRRRFRRPGRIRSTPQ